MLLCFFFFLSVSPFFFIYLDFRVYILKIFAQSAYFFAINFLFCFSLLQQMRIMIAFIDDLASWIKPENTDQERSLTKSLLLTIQCAMGYGQL